MRLRKRPRGHRFEEEQADVRGRRARDRLDPGEILRFVGELHETLSHTVTAPHAAAPPDEVDIDEVELAVLRHALANDEVLEEAMLPHEVYRSRAGEAMDEAAHNRIIRRTAQALSVAESGGAGFELPEEDWLRMLRRYCA
jgi:hypothetical protein